MSSDDKRPTSALNEVLDAVDAELHLRRRDIEGTLRPLEAALAGYRRALEEAAASEYAAAHHLARPKVAGVSPQSAAENLAAAVAKLPGLSAPVAQPAPPAQAKAAAPASTVQKPPTGASPLPLEAKLPKVAAACAAQKLAIIGALAGRRRDLPAPLDAAVEWLDTSAGGAHAVGNLPTRIRQGRVFGVIVCDQSIQHKHSEPVVAAARSASVPVGFAGKGGTGGIARALEAIEDQL